MENPKTVLEKVDASRNLVAQMMLAHRMRDESHFMKCFERTQQLLNEAVSELDRKNSFNLEQE